MRLHIKEADACKCSRTSHGTGRFYFNHEMCNCGGLIIGYERLRTLRWEMKRLYEKKFITGMSGLKRI